MCHLWNVNMHTLKILSFILDHVGYPLQLHPYLAEAFLTSTSPLQKDSVVV